MSNKILWRLEVNRYSARIYFCVLPSCCKENDVRCFLKSVKGISWSNVCVKKKLLPGIWHKSCFVAVCVFCFYFPASMFAHKVERTAALSRELTHLYIRKVGIATRHLKTFLWWWLVQSREVPFSQKHKQFGQPTLILRVVQSLETTFSVFQLLASFVPFALDGREPSVPATCFHRVGLSKDLLYWRDWRDHSLSAGTQLTIEEAQRHMVIFFCLQPSVLR